MVGISCRGKTDLVFVQNEKDELAYRYALDRVLLSFMVSKYEDYENIVYFRQENALWHTENNMKEWLCGICVLKNDSGKNFRT